MKASMLWMWQIGWRKIKILFPQNKKILKMGNKWMIYTINSEKAL